MELRSTVRPLTAVAVRVGLDGDDELSRPPFVVSSPRKCVQRRRLSAAADGDRDHGRGGEGLATGEEPRTRSAP
ncbi:MAG: hypothetical protein CME06_15895 [Gemmatimonadetes bacterium]|nr:hypothetical protein [Gemmatimonadota bacterium]